MIVRYPDDNIMLLPSPNIIKASIAALNFIISSAANASTMWIVNRYHMNYKLQQLGLPKGDHHYSIVLSSLYPI